MNRFLRVFAPHRDNDYTPDILQRVALGIMLALIVISFTMSNLYALLWQSSSWLVGAVLPAVVVENTNHERTDAHLARLVRNPVLDEAARLKAEDMATHGYFAHYSPDGVSPWHWFSEAGYTFAHAGENLAVHFTDSREVVEAWMKSPTHRANIVNGNYQEIGVGTARGRFEGYDTVFVVQLFGTPAATAMKTNDLDPIAVSPVAETSLAVETSEEFILPATQVAGVEADTLPLVTESVKTIENEVVAAPAAKTLTTPTNSTGRETIYLDTLATTSGLTAAPSIIESDEQSVPLAGLATSPSTLLQRIYLGLGMLAVIALVLSVILEWRVARPRQVVYGVGLLCLMSLLFYIHTLVTSGVVVR